ncbi:MAG: hypothetical protein WCF67_15020 [Chitinophagaceae bacterium]
MNFWDYHGILFLLGMTIFPRITLLFFASVSFGFWAMLGLIFAPHLLVAIYATIYYWDANPILCIISWIVALGGTGGEAKIAKDRVSR